MRKKLLALGFLLLFSICVRSADVQWRHLTSARAELPLPSNSKAQSGLVVGDFDGDHTNDFIISFNDVAPALVLYRGATNWSRLPIELDFLPIAAGGTAWDIDRDGDLDVIFGSETGPEIWWWENPSPQFDPNKSWTRHLIKNSGNILNRGQLFADLMGTARPGLVFWNQGSNAVFFTSIPTDPRSRRIWDFTKIFSPPGAQVPGAMESLATADIDMDGNADLLAGNYWLKRTNALQFQATRVGPFQGRSAVGRFRESTIPQIVIAPQAAPGPVFWYECKSHPELPGSWAGRQLLEHDVQPIGTLAIGDLNRDGNDDILVAELASPGPSGAAPEPRAWIIYSDGRGDFRAQLFSTGIEIYDAKLVDLDKDGDLDIVGVARSAGAPRLDIWLNEAVFNGPPVYPK
ncbi:MAG TPA: VCBS repeat-containing protein [Verrucomicrobiae bacterium]|jgi:hypothetical protein|nr:VCBS repeat-containing protein [Verrucomicrobiae bacterium]